MNLQRTLVYLVYRKRNYTFLLIPFLFLVLEIFVAFFLNWELFGEWYKLPDQTVIESSVQVHNPIIVVKALHSQRVTNPFPDIESPFISFQSHKVIFKGLCYLASLIFAYIGLMISVLWIKRFFNENKLDIQWWYWPTGCLGAHLVFFVLANSHINNLILNI